MLIAPKAFRYAAFILIIALALIVMATFREYGITWDEELQSQYGFAVVDYYTSAFKDVRYSQIFNLYLYGGFFDGLASIADAYTPFGGYDTRHLLNAFFGLLGLWGTWKLGRLLGGDFVGFVAMALCAMTPSYYGHMFSNPKDIPFAAGVVWTLYYMSRAYAKPKLGVLAKLGVIFGLTLGVRVGGMMLLAYWMLPMGILALLPLKRKFTLKNFRIKSWPLIKDAARIVLPVVALAYIVMLACWPWAQQAPISNPWRALGEFSNFPQIVDILFDGAIYSSNHLPWYYVPLYFGIQLPEIMLLFLASSVFFLPKTFRALNEPKKQGLVLMLATAFVPVLYAMIRRPALYDAIRHFIFVIPLISIVSALAARELMVWVPAQFRGRDERKAVRYVSGIVFVIYACVQIQTMILLYPYEYIYANAFAGGVRGAYGRFESDYWGSSFKDAAEELQRYMAVEGGVPPGKIYKVAVCGPWSSAMIYMPPNYMAVVANEPAEFFISTTRWQCENMRPGKEIVRIERLGVPLAVVKDLRGGSEYYDGNKKHWDDPPIISP